MFANKEYDVFKNHCLGRDALSNRKMSNLLDS